MKFIIDNNAKQIKQEMQGAKIQAKIMWPRTLSFNPLIPFKREIPTIEPIIKLDTDRGAGVRKGNPKKLKNLYIAVLENKNNVIAVVNAEINASKGVRGKRTVLMIFIL